ncbi:MAG: hypothetical protein NZM25_11525 [Leptospiraceae bacterium]|nr:hypothetical protein [Leptospiraceae bacterium]MDW8307433.1 hypothetical protein [Leptospiraceae bacterium]
MKRRLSILVFGLSLACASVPKLNKTQMLLYMENGKHDEMIAFYKKVQWRLYEVNDHENIKLKGSEVVELFEISKRCYEYMQKANEMMFSGGEVNPRLMLLTSAQLKSLREKFEENLSVVCGKSLREGDYVETGVSLFFNRHFYPFLYTKYKAALAALAYLEQVKKQREEETKLPEEA